MRNPLGGVLHRARHQPAAVHAAVLLARQQAGAFEDAQVFGDGGKRHVERLGEFGDRRLAAREPCQDGAARGVRECAKGGVQRGLRMLNHVV